MKKPLIQCVLSGFFGVVIFASNALSHCEIPCGIYDDAMRLTMIYEHTTTIEKSMKTIMALEKETPINRNQLTRWIMNKEKHADEIQSIVSRYFMTQRIKPDAKAYDKKLKALHEMLIYSMKCKQSTDLKHVETLRHQLNTFKSLYTGR